jgi:hypothetical protein
MATRTFRPAEATVRAGGTVSWINDDDRPHDVTANAGGFTSGLMAPGGRFQHRFPTAGRYHYVCTLHSGMAGSVVVVGADGTLPPPSVPPPPPPPPPPPSPSTSPGGRSPSRPSSSRPRRSRRWSSTPTRASAPPPPPGRIRGSSSPAASTNGPSRRLGHSRSPACCIRAWTRPPPCGTPRAWHHSRAVLEPAPEAVNSAGGETSDDEGSLVSMIDDEFSPRELTVWDAGGVGRRWRGAAHRHRGRGGFDSGLVEPAAVTNVRRFGEEGIFAYTCILPPAWMARSS